MNILVLGIGNAQVDLIKVLSDNHIVHALSYTPSGNGLKFTDYFEVIDIKDKESVLKYAKINDVDLVYSIGSDLGMVTSAWVSEELELPTFVSPEVALLCNNKNLFRSQLKDQPYNVIFKLLTRPSDIDDFRFPCILKPVDSQGQRGVYLVNNKKELIKQFPVSLSFSRSKKLIVEEYIYGPEISVNAYVVNGNVQFSIISDRIVWSKFPGGIIHKHRLPSKVITRVSEPRINQLVVEVIKNLGITNGPVYFQIKLSNNKPKLIEVTPRLDGCHMWRLIKYATGLDLLKISLDHLINDKIDNFETVRMNDNWLLEFICEPPGTVFSKEKYNIDDSNYYEWYYENGEIVKPMNTFMEKCGYQIYQT